MSATSGPAPVPRRVRTWPDRLRVLWFATVRGVEHLIKRSKTRWGLVALLAVWLAVALFIGWGDTLHVLVLCAVGPAVLALGALLGVTSLMLVSESWFFSPGPSRRAMLMMRRWRVRGANAVDNFVAEPSHQRLGSTLGMAFLDDCDRRGITLSTEPADEGLEAWYVSAGFRRTSRPGVLVRKPPDRS